MIELEGIRSEPAEMSSQVEQHVESCICRIEKLNPHLNAFITVLALETRAERKKRASEANSANQKMLDGIVVGIKDFYDTAGIRTTAAFEPFKHRIPTKDAVSVAKLKGAGAIIVGKTNMHTLGMGTTGIESAFGPVRNPWNGDYIPGGSSSGSAAAVASGMCDATLDTDAIGSCRLPAACCGVAGFKGTYGLISPKGILDGEPDPGEMIRWYSHPAITSRRIEVIALLLDALSEAQPPTDKSYVEGMNAEMSLTVGVADNHKAEGELKELFEAATREVAGLVDSIARTSAPLHHPLNDLSKIEADRKAVVQNVFKDIDLLLLPTTTSTVPSVDEARSHPLALSANHTQFANYYGLPAISVPCGFDRNGLPVGLQIVGKPWHESTVLHLAYRFQGATPWNAKHP